MSAQPGYAPPHYEPTPPPISPRPPQPNFLKRIEDFWHRVTDGLALQQLWSQFVTEARSGYRLYSREVEAHSQDAPPRRHQWVHTIGEFFWAIVMKLSPAKRVVLLIGLVLLLIDTMSFGSGDEQFTLQTRLLGGLLILLILVLETADRVTMKRDLEIAREIQRWLVPSEPPKVDGLDIAFFTRAANTVAGDYYDVIPRGNDGKQLLVIADVAGKSMPAALLMATFQASLKTLSATSPDLVDLVCGLNRYASDHSIRGSRFTTAFLAEYDPASRELKYVNAGHNPPLRLRGIAIEPLNAGGVPLGILKDASYESGQTSLQSGDVLAIYTDGVVEAENVGGDEFGDQRMVAALRALPNGTAQQLVQILMAQIEQFVGTAPQHDDITCMVVRCV